MTEHASPGPEPRLDAEWLDREHYWRRKLGRIRLGVEPVEEQLAKYRRVTWMLTAVPLGLSMMFVGLFSAFARPDVGIVSALVLFLPVIVVAWIDYGLLSRRVACYLTEVEEHRKRRANSGRT